MTHRIPLQVVAARSLALALHACGGGMASHFLSHPLYYTRRSRERRNAQQPMHPRSPSLPPPLALSLTFAARERVYRQRARDPVAASIASRADAPIARERRDRSLNRACAPSIYITRERERESARAASFVP